jgi:hypothetical protein
LYKSVPGPLYAQNLQKFPYYSLVHCHLAYGNHIWGCANSSFLTVLYRKQKEAVRIISNSGYRAHTEPIFKRLNILPLLSLIEFFKLQFMQRFVQGHLPPSFNNVWFTNEIRRNETVSMSLRNSDDFYIPVSRLKSYENMPLYSFPKAWSLLTDHSITIILNLDEFNVN